MPTARISDESVNIVYNELIKLTNEFTHTSDVYSNHSGISSTGGINSEAPAQLQDKENLLKFLLGEVVSSTNITSTINENLLEEGVFDEKVIDENNRGISASIFDTIDIDIKSISCLEDLCQICILNIIEEIYVCVCTTLP